MTPETARPKPQVSEEARNRITAFICAVEALQGEYDVTIHCDDGLIALRDDRRTQEWVMSDGTVYGQWDARLFGTDTEYPMISVEAIEFEDFDGWDK